MSSLLNRIRSEACVDSFKEARRQAEHVRKLAQLVHSVHKSQLVIVLKDGLKAISTFDDFLGLEMRRDVIYCWLRKEDES
jgi:hypothetical protein